MDVPVVYLYGPSGVGKSYLAGRFLREARRQAPRLRVIHQTASEFSAAFDDSALRQEQAEFQEQHASAEIFILEDLAALQGRFAAQQMLVAILDELKRSGARFVVTCSSLPGKLSRILPRLASRLRAGVCVPIEPLDEPSRLSFARHLAACRQIPLSAEAIQILAKEGPPTPRELRAALLNFDMQARHNGEALRAPELRAQLRAARVSDEHALSRIAKAVAKAFHVPIADLRSTSRHRKSAVPRQVAMLLGRELSGQPAMAIARFFGRKNHTTVVHACRRTRTLIADDPELARLVECLRRGLRQG